MANKAVRVFIDGSELKNYTGLTLTREKKNLTGLLDIEIFMGYMPDSPVSPGQGAGSEVLVYVGGHLAFTGTIDRRKDAGQLTVDGGQYSVKYVARGKTKALIEGSQQHETGTMVEPTNQGVLEAVVGPFNINVRWEADSIDLSRFRFRDGARALDELQRLAEQCSLYLFETRDGQLRVTDKSIDETGEAIVLGENVLSFSGEIAEDLSRGEVQVKGQLTEPGKWGADAILPTLQKVADSTVNAISPITVQFYGDATPELIEKRAQYEVSKRASQSKPVTVEVFHVQQSSGEPWDLGVQHYVEIPPAGVFDVMEISKVVYHVTPDKTLKTVVTLTPPPVVASTGANAKGPTDALPEIDSMKSIANIRRAKFGLDVNLNTGWGQSVMEVVDTAKEALEELEQAAEVLSNIEVSLDLPPLKLPASFTGDDDE